jgi:MFS family permease
VPLLPGAEAETERALRDRLTRSDWRPTLVAAVLSAAAVAVLIVAFENVSAFERPVALASLTSSVLWIAAALIGSCSTIAALMLTTISLLGRLETKQMPPRVLFHLRLTVLGAVVTIGLAVGALLLTTFPVAGGVDVKPPGWQIDTIFFAMLALTALMIGAFGVVLTSLYATVSDVLSSLPQALVEEIMDEGEREGDERGTQEKH